MWLVQAVIRQGQIHYLFRLGFVLALLWWAVLEAAKGASIFRKTLGAIVVIYCVVQFVVLWKAAAIW